MPVHDQTRKHTVVNIHGQHHATKPSSTVPTRSSSSSSWQPPSVAASKSAAANGPQSLALESNLGSPLRHLLTGSQRLLLLDIKSWLNHVDRTLTRHHALTSEDRHWLQVASGCIEELFLVCFVGEFNSGKSSLINAILGGKYCKTGVLPTTDRINVLRYGPDKSATNGDASAASSASSTSSSSSSTPLSIERVADSAHVHSYLLPHPLLRSVSFCDSPGTNAVLRAHEILTQNFLPRADLVLFLTSAERPFTESERHFLQQVAEWKKKVVLILTKTDLIPNPDDRQEVERFVRNHAHKVLAQAAKEHTTTGSSRVDTTAAAGSTSTQFRSSFPPPADSVDASVNTDEIVMFSVAAEQALKAKQQLAQQQSDSSSSAAQDFQQTSPSSFSSSNSATSSSPSSSPSSASDALASSGLPQLEHYIFSTLSAQTKLHLKLSNPLGIASRVLERVGKQFEAREQEREVDAKILVQMERVLRELETQHLERDFMLQTKKLEALFQHMSKRSDAFVEAKIRASNLREILTSGGGETLKRAYEKEVYGEVSEELERIFGEMLDYIASGCSTASQSLRTLLARRVAQLQTMRKEVGMEQSSEAIEELLSGLDGSDVATLLNATNVSNTTTLATNPSSLTTPSTPPSTSSLLPTASHSTFLALSKDTSTLVSSESQRAESDLLLREAKSALMSAAMLELSAIGLGSAALLQGFSVICLAALPVSVAAGGFVAFGVAGFYALPLLRSRLSSRLRSNLEAQHRSLSALFQRHVRQSMDAHIRSMRRSSIQRMERYAKREEEDVANGLDDIRHLRTDLDSLRARIQDVTQLKPNVDPAARAAIEQESRVVAAPDQVKTIESIEQDEDGKEDKKADNTNAQANKK